METGDLWPSSDNNIYKLSRKIKRKEHSLYNALRSIYEDSLFVGEIQCLWPQLPLLANLRCGLWYSPRFHATCYFKSTDGHTGNCSFNITRLNMHVARLAADKGGCFIVDATRRGKRFPDSMSKTIPIWACVLNRAIHEYRHLQENFTVSGKNKMLSNSLSHLSLENNFNLSEKVREIAGDSALNASSNKSFLNGSWDCSLHLPLWVSETEKANIEKHIDDWVKLLLATGVNLFPLAEGLKKPLCPLWISQSTRIWLNEVPEVTSWSFTPLILVSASQSTLVPERMSDEDFSWNYISGAADDEESWARGLTPDLFWKHAHELITSGPTECNSKVANIVEKERVYRSRRGLEAPQVKVKSLQHNSRENNEGKSDGSSVLGMVSECKVASSFADVKVEVHSFRHEQKVTCFPGICWIGETKLAVGDTSCGEITNLFEIVDAVINCDVRSIHIPEGKEHLYTYLPILSSKSDRFSLQRHLPAAVTFARERLRERQSILIFCSNGEDTSVCICLAILLSLFHHKGQFDDRDSHVRSDISKSDVRQCLVYVCNYLINARPCRGSLRQVFNFLSKEKKSIL